MGFFSIWSRGEIPFAKVLSNSTFQDKTEKHKKISLQKRRGSCRRFFKKLPKTPDDIKLSLKKDEFESVNLYFQDESRFGLMTHLGKCLTAKGVRPVVSCQHRFQTTYLHGGYSPINGAGFVWEVSGVDTTIFEAYLKDFSKHRPKEHKIVVIDNAGLHSTKNMEVPDNIYLLNIPPCSPGPNPCQQVWQYIENRYKNQRFEPMEKLKKWLDEIVLKMETSLIKSITGNHHYLEAFNAIFNV